MQTATYLSEAVLAAAAIVLALVLAFAVVRLTVALVSRPRKASQSLPWDNATEALCKKQRDAQLGRTPPRTIAQQQGSVLPTLLELKARSRRGQV